MDLTVPGIDISHYQGVPDFAKVKAAGKVYVWSEATDGTTPDGAPNHITYRQHRAGALAAGLLFGAYHFLRHGNIPAQVRAFMQATDQLEGCTLPYLLDAEAAGLTVSDVEQFVELVNEPNVLYLGQPAHGQLGAIPSSWALWPLMYPDYTAAQPPTPTPWRQMTVWQHADNGAVPGVAGTVDLSVADPAWIASLHTQPTPPPPPPAPVPSGDPMNLLLISGKSNPGTVYAWDGARGRDHCWPVDGTIAPQMADLWGRNHIPVNNPAATAAGPNYGPWVVEVVADNVLASLRQTP